MAIASIDLEDFTCSICREIFENPVSLSCSHCYCRSCLDGLKKSPSSISRSDILSSSPSHENNQCFLCAICRKESLEYSNCPKLEADLNRLEAPCPHCDKSLVLCEMRHHLEKCTAPPPVKSRNVDSTEQPLCSDLLGPLSESQAEALEKARDGENRSTFQCPFCTRANFTVEHLCKHMEKHHIQENPRRVCPVCASMPWGNKEQLSSNVFNHIDSRHRFEYETYVNYEQDEEAMLADAIQRSLLTD